MSAPTEYPSITADSITLDISYDAATATYTLDSFSPSSSSDSLASILAIPQPSGTKIVWYVEGASGTAALGFTVNGSGGIHALPPDGAVVTALGTRGVHRYEVSYVPSSPGSCHFQADTAADGSAGSKLILLPTPKGEKPRDGMPSEIGR